MVETGKPTYLKQKSEMYWEIHGTLRKVRVKNVTSTREPKSSFSLILLKIFALCLSQVFKFLTLSIKKILSNTISNFPLHKALFCYLLSLFYSICQLSSFISMSSTRQETMLTALRLRISKPHHREEWKQFSWIPSLKISEQVLIPGLIN